MGCNAFWGQKWTTYLSKGTKAFREYIDVFMKIFLNDFTIFSDLSTHLEKFKKCFLKCKEYGISLNPKKCAFIVCSRTILGFIVSKKGKTFYPKKIKALIKMLVPKTPQEIQVFNGMAKFYRCFIKNFASIMALITKLLQKAQVFILTFDVKLLGRISKTSTYTYYS
jgi:hypothetical protein